MMYTIFYGGERGVIWESILYTHLNVDNYRQPLTELIDHLGGIINFFNVFTIFNPIRWINKP